MDFQQRYGWSVLILVLAFAFTVEAADITGTWAIQDLQVADKVQLSLNVIQDGKGSFNNSSAFDISQLRGLTPAQMAAPAGTMARFELVREAGTFACEGYFKAGNGAGTFLFRPDPGFLQQMRAGLSGCQRIGVLHILVEFRRANRYSSVVARSTVQHARAIGKRRLEACVTQRSIPPYHSSITYPT